MRRQLPGVRDLLFATPRLHFDPCHARQENFFHLTPGPADRSGQGLEKQGFFSRESRRRRYNRPTARVATATQFRRVIFGGDLLFEIRIRR
jgi:hypothetical protein